MIYRIIDSFSSSRPIWLFLGLPSQVEEESVMFVILISKMFFILNDFFIFYFKLNFFDVFILFSCVDIKNNLKKIIFIYF